MIITTSQPVPVLEQLIRKVETRLSSMTKGAGYRAVVKHVYRATRRDKRARSFGDVDLFASTFTQNEDLLHSLGVKLQRTVNISADYYIEPSDDDERPIDYLCAVAIAEIERALASDFYPDSGAAYDGLGSNARLTAPQILRSPDDATLGVRVNLSVDYRHSDLDPYNAL